MKKRNIILFGILVFLTLFLIHRFTMELQFFNVSDEFGLPMTVSMPEGLSSISAESCGKCHQEIYSEWKTSIHANAWKDPYFRADFIYDGSQQICLNCHTPLENQQENLVAGFGDSAGLKPILEQNPNFDPALKEEGVTCAVCHIRGGEIYGPTGKSSADHPVKKDESFLDGSSVCRRCHLVYSDRWDTFFKEPLCGTFFEIDPEGKNVDCQKCHMPSMERKNGRGGSHTWRGGHDKNTVSGALDIQLEEKEGVAGKREFVLRITNIGAEHKLPTGIPDRHIEIAFRLLSSGGKVLVEKTKKLERVILWRPFMVDIWDTRLKFMEPFEVPFAFRMTDETASLEVEARYGLLDEKRRKRIKYQNHEPISYRLFLKKVPLKK